MAESDPPEKADPDQMRPSYDFSGGVRGKRSKKSGEGTTLAKLDGDFRAAFPTDEAVNKPYARC